MAAISVACGIGLMTPRPSRAQSHMASAAPAVAPTFEVASVKPSSPQARGIRMRQNPGMLDFANITLFDILAEAYGFNNQLISAPPSLIDRYDIVARIPTGASANQVPAMLQALSSERFKLKVHREMRPTDVWALGVGKGRPKMERIGDASAEPPSHNSLVLGIAGGSCSQAAAGFQRLDNLGYPELGFKAVGVTMAQLTVLLKGKALCTWLVIKQ